MKTGPREKQGISQFAIDDAIESPRFWLVYDGGWESPAMFHVFLISCSHWYDLNHRVSIIWN